MFLLGLFSYQLQIEVQRKKNVTLFMYLLVSSLDFIFIYIFNFISYLLFFCCEAFIPFSCITIYFSM